MIQIKLIKRKIQNIKREIQFILIFLIFKTSDDFDDLDMKVSFINLRTL